MGTFTDANIHICSPRGGRGRHRVPPRGPLSRRGSPPIAASARDRSQRVTETSARQTSPHTPRQKGLRATSSLALLNLTVSPRLPDSPADGERPLPFLTLVHSLLQSACSVSVRPGEEPPQPFSFLKCLSSASLLCALSRESTAPPPPPSPSPTRKPLLSPAARGREWRMRGCCSQRAPRSPGTEQTRLRARILQPPPYESLFGPRRFSPLRDRTHSRLILSVWRFPEDGPGHPGLEEPGAGLGERRPPPATRSGLGALPCPEPRTRGRVGPAHPAPPTRGPPLPRALTRVSDTPPPGAAVRPRPPVRGPLDFLPVL